MQLTFFDKMTVLFSDTKEKAVLLEDISRLLEQDMSIPEVAKDFENYGSSLEHIVGKRLSIAIDDAKPIYTAFDGIISKIALQAMRSSESAAQVSEAFKQAQQALETSEGLFRKLALAHIIPFYKIIAAIIGCSLLGNVIFEQIKMLAPFNKWPQISKLFYSFIQIVDSNLILIGTASIAIPVIVFYIALNITGEIRGFIDKLPFFKHYRVLTAGACLNQLATLLKAGEPLFNAMHWMQDEQVNYAKWHIGLMKNNIKNARNAGNMGKMLDTGLLNQREINRLARNIPSNQLGDRLQQAADNHNEELKRSTARIDILSKSLFLMGGYLLMIWFFASVFFLVLSIG